MLLKLAILAALTLPSWGAIALVNTAVGQNNTGTPVLALATSSPSTFVATSGNAIAVFVQWGSISITVTGVADVAGNSYTAACAAQVRNDNFSSGQWWIAKNISASAVNVVTATFSSTVAFDTIFTRQYSGVDTSSPVDVCGAGNKGTGTSTLTSASFSTVNANEVIMAGGNASGFISYTAGTGYGNLIQDSGPTSATEDKIVSSTQSSVTATMTQSGTAAWLIQVLSLIQASAGGATPNLRTLTGIGK